MDSLSGGRMDLGVGMGWHRPEYDASGLDFRARRQLLSEYGIEIGAGAGQLAGQIWRIGCMGNTARRRNVVALLGALKEVLER